MPDHHTAFPTHSMVGMPAKDDAEEAQRISDIADDPQVQDAVAILAAHGTRTAAQFDALRMEVEDRAFELLKARRDITERPSE